MPASDAMPVPRKNVAYRFYFAIRKPSDSTLITSWAGADSEVSKDGGSYADCTNEATEIGTSGTGYIDLTADEMNADNVLLKVTVTNTGAVPLVFALYPEEVGDYRANAVQVAGQTASASGPVTFPATISSFAGLGANAPANWINAAAIASNAITSAKIATDAIGAAQIAANAIGASELADGAITAAKIASDAITAAKIAAAALNDKGNWNVGKTGYALSTAGIDAIDAALLNAGDATDLIASIVTRIGNTNVDEAAFVAAVKAALFDAGSAANKLSVDASGRVTVEPTSTRSSLGLASANLDTQLGNIVGDTNELQSDWANGGRLDLLIDAVKAKTDSLTFTVSGQVDANIQAVNDVQLVGAGVPSSNPWRPA